MNNTGLTTKRAKIVDILLLVLQPVWFDAFRAIQSVQDKAWVAANGCSLVKTHNAVLNALGCSLRASHETVICVVTTFVKGATIPCKTRLAANRFMTRCTLQTKLVGVQVSTSGFAYLFVVFLASGVVTTSFVFANTPQPLSQMGKQSSTISQNRRDQIIELLREDCGACHGMTLQGGLGPSLLPDTLSRLTQAQIVETISNGRPGTPMPPWKPFFTRQEIEWLAKQLKQGIEDKTQ